MYWIRLDIAMLIKELPWFSGIARPFGLVRLELACVLMKCVWSGYGIRGFTECAFTPSDSHHGKTVYVKVRRVTIRHQ